MAHEVCRVREDSVFGTTVGVAVGVHTIGILTTQTKKAMKKVRAKHIVIHIFHQLVDKFKAVHD